MRLRLRRTCTRTLLLIPALLFGAAASFAQSESPSTPGEAVPGTQGVSPFGGSVPAKAVPGVLPLSLDDAINRGLRQNLGALLSSADIKSARGQRWEQLSALLPHVSVDPYIADSQVNLAELGFTFKFPGFSLPAAVGPFSYFDARVPSARLSLTGKPSTTNVQRRKASNQPSTPIRMRAISSFSRSDTLTSGNRRRSPH